MGNVGTRHSWFKSLYVNYAVPADELKALLHPALEVDTFHGYGIISLMCTLVTDIRFGYLPLPGMGSDEVRVKTYVRHKGKPGYMHLSLIFASEFLAKESRKYCGNRFPIDVAEISLGGTQERTLRLDGDTPIVYTMKSADGPGFLNAKFKVLQDDADGELCKFVVDRSYFFEQSADRTELYEGREAQAPGLVLLGKCVSLESFDGNATSLTSIGGALGIRDSQPGVQSKEGKGGEEEGLPKNWCFYLPAWTAFTYPGQRVA
eukprot:Opistho-1_new@75819